MRGTLRTGAGRARRACARLARRLTGTRRLILMYHRVADVRPDPWELCVSPANFAEQLEVLSRAGFVCLRLRDLARALPDRKLPRRAVAITFDDGYADNLHAAKPLLEKSGTPATVFLVTGAIESAREFWWDELAGVLLQPEALPTRLALTVQGASYEWKLDEAAPAAGPRGARRVPADRSMQRESVYRSVWQLMQPLPEERRQSVLDDLAVWAGRSRRARATHRPLTAAEVVALAEGGLIEIGAHTVTHPSLPSLSRGSQRIEITESKTQSEALLGRQVTSFSYPHGHYTPETVELVRESGFVCACTTAAEALAGRSDPFRLPRLSVGDWNSDEFARRVL